MASVLQAEQQHEILLPARYDKLILEFEDMFDASLKVNDQGGVSVQRKVGNLKKDYKRAEVFSGGGP